MSEAIRVEVAYAERERQTVLALELPPGTTVLEAVERSAIRALHGLPADVAFGIWGRSVAPGTVLEGGERVELYRPVPVDPKETRRALARQGRTMGRGR
jgi:putative ubiquitin-RnfH superfamily antitoxin RatB of RatAB toxin-antitoxin module